MAHWGICSTVKAPTEQVLAFVAHHLDLGARRIWLYFDDPADPAADALTGIERVTVTRCDAAHWRSVCSRRPDKHQNRQTRNMQRTYAKTRLPWLAHIDVDEFLLPTRPIRDLLDALPPETILLPMAPWEALHDPTLADDIFTARHFRAGMRGGMHSENRRQVFGPLAPLLPLGVLSHAVGKCFFRTGIADLEPRLHGAFQHGERLPNGAFAPEIALLHFHAEDPARWKDRLQFRLTLGAYQFNPNLQAHLMAADEAGIDAFFSAVQQPGAATLKFMREIDVLIETDLALRAKVNALLAG